MKPKFKIGDICIAYNDPTFTIDDNTFRYNGEECTVIGVLVNQTLNTANGSWAILPFAYRVKFRDGFTPVAKENELRRKEDDDWVKKKVEDLLFPMPVEFVETTEA
jgi:hypothetical protein